MNDGEDECDREADVGVDDGKKQGGAECKMRGYLLWSKEFEKGSGETTLV